MFKVLLHLLLFSFGVLCSFAQTADSAKVSRHIITAAYFGEQLSRPGGMVGYGYKAVVSKNKQHALVTGAFAGGYHWQYNSRGVFIMPYLGYQLNKPKGFQYDLQLGVGYLHTFADGEVLEYKNGTFSKIRDKGVPRSMLPYVATGIGWHFKNIAKSNVGLTPFLRTGMHGYYPINSLWSFRLHWSLGVEVTLGKK